MNITNNYIESKYKKKGKTAWRENALSLNVKKRNWTGVVFAVETHTLRPWYFDRTTHLIIYLWSNFFIFTTRIQ